MIAKLNELAESLRAIGNEENNDILLFLADVVQDSHSYDSIAAAAVRTNGEVMEGYSYTTHAHPFTLVGTLETLKARILLNNVQMEVEEVVDSDDAQVTDAA